MTDIASLGLEIRSDGVVVAKDRLKDFRQEAGLAEAAAGSLKRLATMGLAAVAVGFAAFGVGIHGAVKRMEEMRKLSSQVDRALKNSGNSARTSASEIEAWADRLEARTGRAAEEIMGVSANLASFGFSRQAFFRSLELADDMSAAWGGDLKQNLEGLARALAEPEKGLAMLTKRGITFTDEQKKMIAGFVEVNDLAGAQGVVFDALEAQVKGVAEAGFGGLEKAIRRGQKAWEDAFEGLVRGEGQSKDLRDTLVDLAETVSSPEFINAVMGFGSVIVQGATLAAQAIVALWGKVQEFMAWLNSQRPGNMAAPDLAGQLAEQRAQLELYNTPGNKSGSLSFLGLDATTKDILDTQDRIKALEAELAKRSDPSKFDVNGVFSGLKGANTFDSPDAMWRAMSPGTMGGQDQFNPYEVMTLGGADKDKAAAKAAKAYAELARGANQFIASQALEARALGVTEQEANRLRRTQDLLNQAANDNLKLTPAMRNELGALATQMAAAEQQTKTLTEAYEFGKNTLSSVLGNMRRDLMNGTSLWDSLGNAAMNVFDSIAERALKMASDGIWDMIFGSISGALGGGKFIGGSAGAPALKLGFQTGIPGFATGTSSAPGGMAWVGERGPELVNLPRGSQVFPHQQSMTMAANQNQANDNTSGSVTVNLIMPEGWKAEILEQAGNNTVKIVQASKKADANYRMSGGN